MEKAGDLKPDAHRLLNKTRMVGKLFGRDKKTSKKEDGDAGIALFLGGSSDELYTKGGMPIGSPMLSRLDMSEAQGWPTKIEARQFKDNARGRSISPKRTRKGLFVHFTDRQPEIIGHGGDETEEPPSQIAASRRRAHTHPIMIAQTGSIAQPFVQSGQGCNDNARKSMSDTFQPQPIRQTQTGHVPSSESISNTMGDTSVRTKYGHDLTQSAGTCRSTDLFNPVKYTSSKSATESLGASKHRPIVETTTLPDADILSSDDVFDVFYIRVQHFFKLFILSAESIMPLSRTSTEDLMRAALWWFLKGRTQIEQAAQGRPLSVDGHLHKINLLSQQAHVDLAKSLWIISNVLPGRSEIAHAPNAILDKSAARVEHNGEGRHDPKFADGLQALRSNLRKLTLSMRRNGLLPMSADDVPLSPALDLGIWVAHPSSIPEVSVLLSGLSSLLISTQSNITETFPVGDTVEFFVYGRMFVDFYLAGEGIDLQQSRCPCILSICRKRSEKNIIFTVASQNGLIALSIQSNSTRSLNWHHVRWNSNVTSLEIELSTSLMAHIRLAPGDYKTLWSMYDFTSRTHAELYPRKDEVAVFEDTVMSLQYSSHDNRSSFPREPCLSCQVRVFEKISTEMVGGSTHIKHCGFRIAATTSPSTKKLSGLSQILSTQDPVRYNFVAMEGSLQGIQLSFDDGPQKATLVLGFRDVQHRAKFHESLVGRPRSTETVVARIALEDIYMQDTTDPTDVLRFPCSTLPRTKDVWIIRENSREGSGIDKAKAFGFQNLRLLFSLREGFFNDRVGMEPGDLQLRLSAESDTHTLAVLRKPQLDMTLSIAESSGISDTSKVARKILHTMANNGTVRTYQFSTLNDLHIFQTVISGFDIAFDGMASSFAISRRRMVVPIYKKWEAATTRLQVLRQGKSTQLVAFFDGFSHGDCMNFALKVTDTFESFSKGSHFSIRLVDAKFALPRGSADDDNGPRHDKGFVCLDEPDYPSEHDDIIISFASEAERNRFVGVLPAPVKIVSRMGTVRR